jgi:hypothetical protein
MAGVMVATDEASFNRLSIQTVERILSEVGVTHEQAIAQAHSIAHLLDEGHKGDTSLRNRDLTIVTFPIAPLASL